jgi:hypothetical protein
MGVKEELKLFFSAGAFVLALLSVALSIRIASVKTAPSSGQTILIESEPIVDPAKAAEIRAREKKEEFDRMEEEALKKKREWAQRALDELNKRYDGKIPDTLILATKMEIPRPFGDESKEKLMVEPLPVMVDIKNKRIEFLALFHQSTRQGGIVEVMLSTTIGALDHRAYEAISVTRINPHDLWLALLLLGLQPAKGVYKEGEQIELVGDKVDVIFHWLNIDGTPKSAYAEDFIYCMETHKTADRSGWVFVGSRVGFDPIENREVLGTEKLGDIILVWHHPAAILDLPSKEGGKSDYFIYNSQLLPYPASCIHNFCPLNFFWAEDDGFSLISVLTKVVITPHKDKK